MNLFEDTEESTTGVDRRQFLKGVGMAGASVIAGGLLAGCGGNSSVSTKSSSSGDAQILGAAKIAEALAVSMYTAFNASAIYTGLPAADQAYFQAALNEEMYHYNLLKSVTGNTDAPLTYYFPTGMFTDPQTTVNVMTTLEEAFIAAYLIGVKNFSSPSLRVLAAQIMGVESDHRTLIRTAAGDLNLTATTGLSGMAEPVQPSNNSVYERTFGLSSISQVVTALTPFLSASASNTVAAQFNPAFVPSGAGLVGNPPA